MKLSDVIRGMDGTLLSDGEFRSIAFATEETQSGFLTFLEKEKFLSALRNPGISCVLIKPELADRVPPHIHGVFVCDAPKAALFTIHNALSKDEAYVGPSFPTRIGKNCNISPLAVIPERNVIIGDEVTIEPFVVLKGRVTIKDHTVIHSGAMIGCKGFSFSADKRGEHQSVIDTAQIVIEERVELFEQVAITTGIFPWEKTIIGKNTKVDTQSFIAHGTHIGQNSLIVAGARCCGNCQIGHDVWIGAGAIISNRIRIGDHARVSLGSVVTKDVSIGQTVTGNFAIDHARFMQNLKASVASQTDGNDRPIKKDSTEENRNGV